MQDPLKRFSLRSPPLPEGDLRMSATNAIPDVLLGEHSEHLNSLSWHIMINGCCALMRTGRNCRRHENPRISFRTAPASSTRRHISLLRDAGNLEKLTPPWLHFHVLTPLPVEMQVGVRIDYQLRVRGVPLRWQSEITAWEQDHRFVDEQRRGPYRVWRHEHLFERCGGGTRVIDHVRYAVHFDFLIHGWLVRPDVERIFAFRRKKLVEDFGELKPVAAGT